MEEEIQKRVEADQDVSVDLLIGNQLVAQASQRAKGKDQAQLVFR